MLDNCPFLEDIQSFLQHEIYLQFLEGFFLIISFSGIGIKTNLSLEFL